MEQGNTECGSLRIHCMPTGRVLRLYTSLQHVSRGQHSMPRFVVAEREEAEEESSSEEEQSEEEEEDCDEQEEEQDAAGAAQASADAARLQSNGQAGPSASGANASGGPRGKLKIQLGAAKAGKGLVCHVRALRAVCAVVC